MKKKLASPTVTREGIIYRTAEGFAVEALDASGSLKKGVGVVCVNPRAPEKKRIYRKEFRQKRIYLPEEYDLAVRDHLSAPCTMVISANGYSTIDDEQCRRYGVQPGAYEEAVAALVKNAIRHLRVTFPAVNIKLIDGASDLGVDKALAQVAEDLAMQALGFSCPRYMLYVPDDSRAVYVAETQAKYADSYIRSLDLLITTGGRKQALEHDVLAACVNGKRIHVVDVLNALSTTGGVPATIQKADGTIVVDNAAAAFGRNISFCALDRVAAVVPTNGDKWDAIFGDVNAVAQQVCRARMPVGFKFQA